MGVGRLPAAAELQFFREVSPSAIKLSETQRGLAGLV